MEDIADLIERTRAMGMTIRYQDQRTTLPEGEGVSAEISGILYRVCQQSISNVLQHAPGAEIAIDLRGGDENLTFSVRNTAADPARSLAEEPIAGGGRGLPVMRHRVESVGGTFSAGPIEDGGWLVEATVPLTLVAQEEPAASRSRVTPTAADPASPKESS